ncbi:2-amino-4-hydroxy-6-hydroxymethyldihydropteridine diphosphokinase [Mesobaculum littorinae]|uniref:2-amino-4-hydroxy-6-hydroxymethyldihydropteridine pyrophosphokinase n=1 Tax=Mesobaculum littorinae TaxID=2486419 RepID=A0A438AG51_9RHOB|nr:2-amino-4-hydroxy-6-hydroxymethyldihydropteridine diphosphokinase [Mesobaculum littorinae]
MSGRRAVLVALGGNLPLGTQASAASLERALVLLDRPEFRLVRRSRMFRTPAFPAGAGPDFANAAAVFVSALPAERILARLHAVERALGRRRRQRWGPRTVDLDLLAVGGAVLPDALTLRRWQRLPLARQMRETPDRVLLPHPRLQDRGFVLVPLAEVAPGWRHPLSHRSVAEMAADLPAAARAGIEPL